MLHSPEDSAEDRTKLYRFSNGTFEESASTDPA
jgi:hypothetical protein